MSVDALVWPGFHVQGLAALLQATTEPRQRLSQGRPGDTRQDLLSACVALSRAHGLGNGRIVEGASSRKQMRITGRKWAAKKPTGWPRRSSCFGGRPLADEPVRERRRVTVPKSNEVYVLYFWVVERNKGSNYSFGFRLLEGKHGHVMSTLRHRV